MTPPMLVKSIASGFRACQFVSLPRVSSSISFESQRRKSVSKVLTRLALGSCQDGRVPARIPPLPRSFPGPTAPNSAYGQQPGRRSHVSPGSGPQRQTPTTGATAPWQRAGGGFPTSRTAGHPGRRSPPLPTPTKPPPGAAPRPGAGAGPRLRRCGSRAPARPALRR